MVAVMLKDGFVIKKQTHQQIVNELRQMEIIPCESNAEYMKRVANRFKIYYGEKLDCSSELEFVNQLIKYNELVEVKNNGV